MLILEPTQIGAIDIGGSLSSVASVISEVDALLAKITSSETKADLVFSLGVTAALKKFNTRVANVKSFREEVYPAFTSFFDGLEILSSNVTPSPTLSSKIRDWTAKMQTWITKVYVSPDSSLLMTPPLPPTKVLNEEIRKEEYKDILPKGPKIGGDSWRGGWLATAAVVAIPAVGLIWLFRRKRG